jgi:hypothetical protein
MNDTATRKPNGAYPCPNPGPNGRPGCWCPSSSSRCYGDIRAMREDFRALLSSGYPREDAAQIAATLRGGNRWLPEEILRRF